VPYERTRPAHAVLTALAASLAGWAALVVTVVLISEIAAAKTFMPGVASSSWTPLRGVTALVIGPSAFGGGFSVLPILGGLAGLLIYCGLFGASGVLLLLAVQGPRPHALGALVQGVAYGAFVEACVLNALITGLVQSTRTIYESMPSWGWWAGHAAFGATLGLVTAALGRRRAATRPVTGGRP
jgi:hypothetical protein